VTVIGYVDFSQFDAPLSGFRCKQLLLLE